MGSVTNQLDRETGRYGDTQLERRWVLIETVTGHHAYPRQGRYAFDDAAARERLTALGGGYEAVAFWCWPGHLDPAIACVPKHVLL